MRSRVDLFAKTEIQIKKAISFTTFQCCHSLLNHKSSVMTDFVCFAGMSWGRAEEACGVCWAMTDVGRTLKCIFSFCKRCVFWVEMVAADRWLCSCMSAGTQPMFGVVRIWVSKWCVDSFLTFMNEGCAKGWVNKAIKVGEHARRESPSLLPLRSLFKQPTGFSINVTYWTGWINAGHSSCSSALLQLTASSLIL